MLDAIKKKLHDEVQALTYELTVTPPETLEKAIARAVSSGGRRTGVSLAAGREGDRTVTAAIEWVAGPEPARGGSATVLAPSSGRAGR